jgi:soluble lytic murein transglycosylase-like protein
MREQMNYATLARTIAAQHKLLPELVCAVAEEESGLRNMHLEDWDPAAVKPERGFFLHYIHPAVPAAPTVEELMRSWSYGLMQILGQTARERGFAGRFFTELCFPAIGLEFGCRELAHCFARAQGNLRDTLNFYNGGADAAYPDRVLARVDKYRVTVDVPAAQLS